MSRVSIEIDFGSFPDDLKEFIELLDGKDVEDLGLIGARAASESAAEYHRDFNQSDGWINPSLPTHGSGRVKTRFGETIARGWRTGEVTKNHASIVNAAPHYRHKVKGGTITAKRAEYLTIPLVPKAHGVRASEYVRLTGNKLFPVGLEDDDQGVLAEDLGNGEIRAIYVLKKEVTQDPWDGALPPEEDLAEAFAGAVIDKLIEALDD